MTKRWLVIVVAFVVMCQVSGCSVMMAMSGEQEPDLGAVRVGATRGEVELQLGKADSITTLDDGRRLDKYKYQLGNEPSAARAIGHGAMDVLTLGLWELIGTPIEGFQGENCEITVCYDENDVVVAINRVPLGVPTVIGDSDAPLQHVE